MTWRELRSFIRHVPADSAYVRAALEARGEDPDWTLDTYIARAAANAVISANYQRAGKRAPDKALIPEPGKRRKAPSKAEPNDQKQLTQQEFDALFGG